MERARSARALGAPLSITLNQLEVFATVAREGSFTRAGAVLVRSEAAISQQIRLLEEAVGVKLVERSPGRPLRLTEAGTIVLASSEAVLQQLAHVIDQVHALANAEAGSVAIGSGAYFGSYLLPPICATFQQRPPRIRTHLHIARGVDCLEALRRGEIDLAVVDEDVIGEDLAHSQLAGKDVVWIGPPGHRLSGGRRVAVDELNRETLVLAPTTAWSRRALDRWANAQGLKLRPGLEVGGAEAQVTAVRNRVGIAAVPAHVLSRYPTQVEILNVDGFPIRENWSVVWRGEQLSSSAASFRDHLLKERALIESSTLYRSSGPST